MEDKITERIATLEANDTNIFHQLAEIKTEVKDIRRLTTAVEKIAVQTENITVKVDGIDQRLGSVENAPLQDFTVYRRTIINTIITGVAGAILGALLSFIIGR